MSEWGRPKSEVEIRVGEETGERRETRQREKSMSDEEDPKMRLKWGWACVGRERTAQMATYKSPNTSVSSRRQLRACVCGRMCVRVLVCFLRAFVYVNYVCVRAWVSDCVYLYRLIMCACVCLCDCVWVYVYVKVCASVCLSVCVRFLYVRVFECVFVCACMWLFRLMCLRVHECIYQHLCVCVCQFVCLFGVCVCVCGRVY